MEVKYITGIKYDGYAQYIAARKLGRKVSQRTPPRKYGIYRQAEGPLSYIADIENNAPAMSERLWKIREQLTIAEKIVFDTIIELPPMDKKESVSKIAEYLNLSKAVVYAHKNAILALFDSDDLKEKCND